MQMPREPVLPPQGEFVRTSSAEHAALLIRRLIFDGDLRPGDRVPQDDIAAALGISRIPVREALIALEREGWLTIELHRGAFINALDARSVRDNYELFGLVYGLAARRAVERADAGALLASLADRKAAMTTSDDPADVGRAIRGFHGDIVDAAASPRIKVVLRAMSALIPGEFFEFVPEAIAVERRGLAAVLRALRKGDGNAAADEYLKMMRKVGEQVVAEFDARGLFAGSDVPNSA
jgi:DNA-binding GntR family transcriptional regulator